MTNTALIGIYRSGQTALKRLNKGGRDWYDWLAVGRALKTGRDEAIRLAGSNGPYGAPYKDGMNKFLLRYGFDKIEKTERSRLIELMENLPAVEAWRNQLSGIEQAKLNNPSAVLRRWKKDTEAASDRDDLWRKPSTKDQLEAAKAELRKLRQGAEVPWAPGDAPPVKAKALATWMMRELSIGEAIDIIQAVAPVLEAARRGADDAVAMTVVDAALEPQTEGTDADNGVVSEGPEIAVDPPKDLPLD